MGRNEFDALFEEKSEPGKNYYYLAPALECSKCYEPMWLPYYSGLPQSDMEEMPLAGEDPLDLPSEGWSKIFGCTRCGHIATYLAADVEVLGVQKPTRSRFHAHADVWHVLFACGNTHCKAPFAIHLSMPDNPSSPNATDASAVVRAARNPVFDGHLLPCGHRLKAIPSERYHATPVKDRMW